MTDDDQAQRIAAQLAESVARRARRAEMRQQFAAARTAGLTRRHAARLDQAQRAESHAQPRTDPAGHQVDGRHAAEPGQSSDSSPEASHE